MTGSLNRVIVDVGIAAIDQADVDILTNWIILYLNSIKNTPKVHIICNNDLSLLREGGIIVADFHNVMVTMFL